AANFLDGGLCYPQALYHILINEWIISENVHTIGLGALDDLCADAAGAADAEGLTVEFYPDKLLLIPAAFMHAAISLGAGTGEGRKHGHGVFSGGDGIAARGVHDDDTHLGGGCNVDVVETNAGAADDFQDLAVF